MNGGILICFLILGTWAVSDQEGFELTMEAFRVCEFDGIDGLSWEEVETCEKDFGKYLSVPCPTKANFDAFDADQNGIMTMEEYLN